MNTKLKILAAAAALLLGGCATTQTTTPAKVVVIPTGWDAAYDKYYLAPAIRVGDTVVLSGVPAARGDTYDEKVRGMFERVKSVLAAAGCDMSDVVEIDTYHSTAKDTATFRQEFDAFLKIHHEYFPDRYPAWTAIGTTALLANGAVVEMRVTAVAGAGRKTEIHRQS